MACFSLAWLEQLLIWIVVVCVLVGIVKVLMPLVMGLFGAPPGGGAVMTILGYVLWGIAAVFVIIFVIDLVSCALGGGTLHGSFLRGF